jgi:hypothetical protein
VQGLNGFLLEEIPYCFVERIGDEVRKWEKWEKCATRYAARLAMLRDSLCKYVNLFSFFFLFF